MAQPRWGSSWQALSLRTSLPPTFSGPDPDCTHGSGTASLVLSIRPKASSREDQHRLPLPSITPLFCRPPYSGRRLTSNVAKPTRRLASVVTAPSSRFITAAAVLHGSVGRAHSPQPRSGSCDADGLRASQLEHAVQRMDGNVHLGRPTLVRAGAQPVADHLLEPAHGGLDPGANVVSGGLLPSHAAHLGDRL